MGVITLTPDPRPDPHSSPSLLTPHPSLPTLYLRPAPLTLTSHLSPLTSHLSPLTLTLDPHPLTLTHTLDPTTVRFCEEHSLTDDRICALVETHIRSTIEKEHANEHANVEHGNEHGKEHGKEHLHLATPAPPTHTAPPAIHSQTTPTKASPSLLSSLHPAPCTLQPVPSPSLLNSLYAMPLSMASRLASLRGGAASASSVAATTAVEQVAAVEAWKATAAKGREARCHAQTHLHNMT